MTQSGTATGTTNDGAIQSQQTRSGFKQGDRSGWIVKSKTTSINKGGPTAAPYFIGDNVNVIAEET